MDGDEGLKLGAFHLGHVPSGLGDECVQKFEERIVGLRHDLAVILSAGQGLRGVARPDHLNSQQSNLKSTNTVQLVVRFDNVLYSFMLKSSSRNCRLDL